MRDNPERLAWAILLVSFFACCGLAVGIPLSVRYYILHATTPQDVTLEVQRAPLRVVLAGRGEQVAIAEERRHIPMRTVIATDATSGLLVMNVSQTDDTSTVATAQLYDETEIVLIAARSPRFPISQQPHRVILEVRQGRARISVSDYAGRATLVEIRTPHGRAVLTAGSHEIKVSQEQMEVTVRDGSAEVEAGENSREALKSAERAIAADGRVSPPMVVERSILVNGDFRQPLENGWRAYTKDVQFEPPGTVEDVVFMGRPVARFHREGRGHAEIGIYQDIRYDVRDFASLVLQLSVQVEAQSLPGCGSLGSECPIIVRIDYKDIYGGDREWYHGFYAQERAETDLLHPWSEQIPFQTWYAYDSGNLNEVFEAPPALIQRVTIYASGHSFDAMVTEVELWAQE